MLWHQSFQDPSGSGQGVAHRSDRYKALGFRQKWPTESREGDRQRGKGGSARRTVFEKMIFVRHAPASARGRTTILRSEYRQAASDAWGRFVTAFDTVIASRDHVLNGCPPAQTCKRAHDRDCQHQDGRSNDDRTITATGFVSHHINDRSPATE